MQKVHNQKGFTLVEVAIVLVIIGLLLGGVLKGQELIENSKVKSVTSDFENITAAYYAYRDRKGEYPTDDGSDTADPNFWIDLRTEGFITGAPTNADGPTHALDGVFTYDTDGTPFDKAICASNIEGSTAINIDTKFDDGLGVSGDIQSSDSAAYVDDAEVIVVCKKL